jgi:hypothetical protein
MICSPISWHLRGRMARIGAARGQVLHLLRPHRRQRAGDGCLAERRRPRFLAWTCCSTHRHRDYNLKFRVQGGKIQIGHNFKFELTSIDSGPSVGPSLPVAHIQSCSPSWSLSSCRLAALSSELGR